ncbi:glycosyltransferase [Thalassobacter stenotrophicus]|uniref:Poly-beta-1,6-N-acetyl-D-glucosamine synthase n=2 Tax=Thalassobacter stenotrophicus TaxID=266809 RepID=A0A0P1FIB0_9RHOB|nr:glycosyltransferase [Thalassobacter stenotrophicus]PVZ47523.1 glycosyltransferase family 2 protein [Thalassobacter stenotrophicus]CUH60311.1 Poly-beta-1,6-N-acetyl-D-glucosamine synthase [Thalassobacter stenotrophicus]SHI72462.1 Glycosyltransferase, catalytic subunit of cellulose synthase and poly-beta-1,6-N-acetylglucosamine synthase [Thalassobacter stenotrophicus DSM 16310]
MIAQRPKDAPAKRSTHEFWSVDSAPKQFSHQVPQSRAPLLLVVFCVLSTASLWGLGNIPLLAALFPQHDIYFFQGYQGYYTVSVRTFILCFYISFAVFMDRRPGHMFGMMVDMCLSYLAFCVLLDGASAVIHLWLGVALHVNVVAIVSGVAGFAIYSFKLLERGRMPPPIAMEIDTRRNWQTMATVGCVALLCAGLSVWVTLLDLNAVHALRNIALLGGIGPGVFLFLPSFFVTLYLVSSLMLLRDRHRTFMPPVTIFVPAHNEAHIIARVIAAADASAAQYADAVHMIIANNNSTDDTHALADRALGACAHMTGEVFLETRAGKSHALNAAIDRVQTEYMIRLDADTIMFPDALVKVMRHFRDPLCGAVGGLPFSPGGGLFDRARFLEALVKHGFYSVGFTTINSVVGVPGMFAAYCTELPRKLGGFVNGMNGEDTDMSLRIGELGYRLVCDPDVQFESEVPGTYHHMREQRMRWFRSVYHISSRCRALIFSAHATVRGKVVLPYMLVNSGRRAMVVPLVLFGLIEYFGGFHTLRPLEVQAVIAVAVGAPALLACFACLINGKPMALLYLPEYLIFRILRAYFTLESMLSISIKSYAESLDEPVLDVATIRGWFGRGPAPNAQSES